MGNQYQKEDARTVIASAAVSANRFIGFDGAHATSAGAGHDSCGISECDAVAGQALSVITEYSGLVVAAEDLAQFAFVKPAADGSGKAALGTATDHCGRALEAVTAGQLVECQVLDHRHS